jgi:oligosaccharide repeat unit polymerase
MLSSMSSIVPAVLLLAVFAGSLMRLPALHPLQIWSGSWTISLTAYALRLLPYRHLSWLTVLLICGSTLIFALGALVGQRIDRLAAVKGAAAQRQALSPAGVRLAARISLIIGGLLLAVFLGDLARRYGVTSALRVSRNVRLALVSGSAPKAFAYSEFAIAASALCALAAAQAQHRASRRRWLLACACAVASLYFSTARQLVVDALIVALVVVALSSGWRVARGRLIALLLAVGIAALVVFIGVGAIIGNTYQTNDVSKFDNLFSRNSAISWAAPAYVDVSAPIPALEIAVHVSNTWGRAYGCATWPFECHMLHRLGLHVEQQPLRPPFTQFPLPWNAYTFLGSLLNDGGTALVLLLVGLCGALCGAIWSLHRVSPYGTLAYAFVVPALVWAYRQNLLDVQLDAALLVVLLAWVATRLCHSTRLERLFRLRSYEAS